MCAINGIFAYHYASNPIDGRELERTRDRMAARGPDGKGAWIADDGRVGLGHRRLSVIDLSPGGNQPMLSHDGRIAVSFNGEIYNYAQLRQRLIERGHVFRSKSDTEVLLHLYARLGPELVHELRGMFAFAIWDAVARRLVLARDPYGIKPLYYSDDGWSFRFASQVKALLAGGGVSRDPDPAGIVGFYSWGSVPEPFTIWRNIRALPAGTTMVVDQIGAHEPQRYHSIAGAYRDAESRGGAHGFEPEATRSALLDSVRCHLVADVPVGAFLSAGVDSGALVGLMRDAGADQISSVTVAFEEFRGRNEDEAPLAAEVAAEYGTDHTKRVVTRAEFEADLPLIMDAMDQPSIDGINTWFVAKAAHEHGLKVAISGLGGDELLGGYPSFRNIPNLVGAAAIPSGVPGLGTLARWLAAPLARSGWLHPKSAGMIEFGGGFAGAYFLQRGLFMPWELGELLDREFAAEGWARLQRQFRANAASEPNPTSAFAKVANLESSLYMRNQLLRDTDWASMAHSLEVRVPLVDRDLLTHFAPLAGRFGAWTGKEVLANAPSLPMPDRVVRRSKTGFGTPLATWLEQQPIGRPPLYPGQLNEGRSPWARNWSRVIGDLAMAA